MQRIGNVFRGLIMPASANKSAGSRSLRRIGIVGIGLVGLFLIMAGCADDGNNGNGGSGNRSNCESSSDASADYNCRVSNLRAYAGHNSVWVHWTAPNDNQFQGVIIEYTASGGSDRTTDIIAAAGQDGSADVSATNGTAYTIALYAVDKNGNRGVKQRAGSVTPGVGVVVICGRQRSSTNGDVMNGAVTNRNRNGGVPEIGMTIMDTGDSNFNANNHVWCLDAGRSRDSTSDLANDLAQLLVTALGEMLKDGQPLADDDTTTVNIAQRQFTRANGSRPLRFVNQTVNVNSVFGSSGTRTINFTGGFTESRSIHVISRFDFTNPDNGTATVSVTMP